MKTFLKEKAEEVGKDEESFQEEKYEDYEDEDEESEDNDYEDENIKSHVQVWVPLVLLYKATQCYPMFTTKMTVEMQGNNAYTGSFEPVGGGGRC